MNMYKVTLAVIQPFLGMPDLEWGYNVFGKLFHNQEEVGSVANILVYRAHKPEPGCIAFFHLEREIGTLSPGYYCRAGGLELVEIEEAEWKRFDDEASLIDNLQQALLTISIKPTNYDGSVKLEELTLNQ